MTDPERKVLRLNVLCPSRDKKFVVFGKKGSTVAELSTEIKKMFNKMYPGEEDLKISSLKNAGEFDIFSTYRVSDLFKDDDLLNISEDEQKSAINKDTKKLDDSTSPSEFIELPTPPGNEDQEDMDDQDDDEEEKCGAAKKEDDGKEEVAEKATASKKAKKDESFSKKSKAEEATNKDEEDEEKDDDKTISKESKRVHNPDSEDEQDKKKRKHKTVKKRTRTVK